MRVVSAAGKVAGQAVFERELCGEKATVHRCNTASHQRFAPGEAHATKCCFVEGIIDKAVYIRGAVGQFNQACFGGTGSKMIRGGQQLSFPEIIL